MSIMTGVPVLSQRGLWWAAAERSFSFWSSWCCWWTLLTPGTSRGLIRWRTATQEAGMQVSELSCVPLTCCIQPPCVLEHSVYSNIWVCGCGLDGATVLFHFSTFCFQLCLGSQSSTTSCLLSSSCCSTFSTPNLRNASLTSSSSASTCCSAWWPRWCLCCLKYRYSAAVSHVQWGVTLYNNTILVLYNISFVFIPKMFPLEIWY